MFDWFLKELATGVVTGGVWWVSRPLCQKLIPYKLFDNRWGILYFVIPIAMIGSNCS